MSPAGCAADANALRSPQSGGSQADCVLSGVRSCAVYGKAIINDAREKVAPGTESTTQACIADVHDLASEPRAGVDVHECLHRCKLSAAR